MPDQIDQYAPNGGVVDVTGNRLSFIMRYADEGAANVSDHVDIGSLAGSLAVFEIIPLSVQFDNLWQGKPDLKGDPTVDDQGKSLRDQIIIKLDKSIKDAISGAFAFTNDIPMNGTVRAFAADLHLFLSYKIPSCSVNFSVPIALGIDATYVITFELEVLIILGFQDWPHLVPIVAASVNGLDISADNLAADVAQVVKNLFDENIKTLLQLANPPPASNPTLAKSIGAIMDIIESVAVPAGFKSCAPDVDAESRTPRLVLIHPLDPAPTLEQVTPGDEGFFHPTLGANRLQVHGGDAIMLTGANFPADRASRAGVQWNDTVSGALLRSDVDVSINNAPAKRVAVPRQVADTKNVFFATSLAPKSQVTFSVRDCDKLTCTPFSNTVAVSTDLPSTVGFSLQSGGVSVGLPGSATVDANGAFSSAVTIPNTIQPGVYRLSASVGSAEAGVSITVLPTAQPPARQLQQIDPNTGRIVNTLITPNQLVGVRGDGFPPGRATISIQLDTGAGARFGGIVTSATTDVAGSFTATFNWPSDSTGGAHKITAVIFAIPPQVGATLDVFVELSPR
jgi:hypothetical protein